eukprot:CAMPEP_0114991350 /NCGR_PEP_ID=MMETSP0216-20121206/11318_1 /TAXON_ID=223996 /ORGANISM="Protocruzia adherens, Strain Boccale" /LENGTH=316 /DNA_ID=CAMNT_0002354657 /DNA_START=29 /DNA_END=979 /DNA_ORIENTATION=-
MASTKFKNLRRIGSLLNNGGIFRAPIQMSMSTEQVEVTPKKELYKWAFNSRILSMAKTLRHGELEATIMPRTKYIIDVLRVRQESDTLEQLKANNEIAAVINGRPGHPEVNFVLDRRMAYHLSRQSASFARPFYLKFDDYEEPVRVNLDDIHFHNFVNGWPLKMYFHRFVPGKPNPIRVKIVPVGLEHSKALEDGCTPEIKEETVDLVTSIEDYPKELHFDVSFMKRGQRYQIKHLQQLLPEGVSLDPHYVRSGRIGTVVLKMQPPKEAHFVPGEEDKAKREEEYQLKLKFATKKTAKPKTKKGPSLFKTLRSMGK